MSRKPISFIEPTFCLLHKVLTKWSTDWSITNYIPNRVQQH